jgi:hypothetical protein
LIFLLANKVKIESYSAWECNIDELSANLGVDKKGLAQHGKKYTQ